MNSNSNFGWISKKMGAHPKATPKKDEHMQLIEKVDQTQPALGFIREGPVTLNPAQANFVLRETGYDKNRRISVVHVSTLAEMMRRGSWLPKDTIAFARLPNGRLVLMNGHHRLAAQIESMANVLWNVVIHDCADKAEVAALYYRFDTNVRRRSDENILQAVEFAAGAAISAEWRRAIWRAVPILAAGLVANRQTRDSMTAKLTDDRLQVANAYITEGIILCRAMSEMPIHLRRKMQSGALSATSLTIIRSEPAVGETFFSTMATNDRLPRHDARSTFLTWLAGFALRSASESSGPVALAKAWNAFRDGRDLRMIRLSPGQAVKIARTNISVCV